MISNDMVEVAQKGMRSQKLLARVNAVASLIIRDGPSEG
jgi:hypothetical protein